MPPAWNWNLTVSASPQQLNCGVSYVPILGVLNGIILIVDCLKEFGTNCIPVKILCSCFTMDALAFIFSWCQSVISPEVYIFVVFKQTCWLLNNPQLIITTFAKSSSSPWPQCIRVIDNELVVNWILRYILIINNVPYARSACWDVVEINTSHLA